MSACLHFQPHMRAKISIFGMKSYLRGSYPSRSVNLCQNLLLNSLQIMPICESWLLSSLHDSRRWFCCSFLSYEAKWASVARRLLAKMRALARSLASAILFIGVNGTNRVCKFFLINVCNVFVHLYFTCAKWEFEWPLKNLLYNWVLPVLRARVELERLAITIQFFALVMVLHWERLRIFLIFLLRSTR